MKDYYVIIKMEDKVVYLRSKKSRDVRGSVCRDICYFLTDTDIFEYLWKNMYRTLEIQKERMVRYKGNKDRKPLKFLFGVNLKVDYSFADIYSVSLVVLYLKVHKKEFWYPIRYNNFNPMPNNKTLVKISSVLIYPDIREQKSCIEEDLIYERLYLDYKHIYKMTIRYVERFSQNYPRFTMRGLVVNPMVESLILKGGNEK